MITDGQATQLIILDNGLRTTINTATAPPVAPNGDAMITDNQAQELVVLVNALNQATTTYGVKVALFDIADAGDTAALATYNTAVTAKNAAATAEQAAEAALKAYVDALPDTPSAEQNTQVGVLTNALLQARNAYNAANTNVAVKLTSSNAAHAIQVAALADKVAAAAALLAALNALKTFVDANVGIDNG